MCKYGHLHNLAQKWANTGPIFNLIQFQYQIWFQHVKLRLIQYLMCKYGHLHNLAQKWANMGPIFNFI